MASARPSGNIPKAPNMDDFVIVPTKMELELAQKRQDHKENLSAHEKATQKDINKKN